MKAIMVMFDTLNRHMLPPYGCEWTHAPNFERLARRAVTFDNAYVGSMPCMPARRELHTGRYNFLHRSWGPVEPFDDSTPEILKSHGVYTHLVSDHYHYWEDGAATYHNRYSSWEIVRGQEGDAWKGHVKNPDIPPSLARRDDAMWRQDWVNRQHMPREEDQPQHQTFELGMEFIRTNHDQDNWFLQLETFDPHEPFFTQEHYKALYPHHYEGPHWDWPHYKPLDNETPEQIEHLRYQYAALLSMCDAHLGKVLDLMDKLDLWDDTLLIVNTDHGFLLGEHEWMGKVRMPFYNEVAQIPLFIWDPRSPQRAGERCRSLVQTIDLPATLLDYFGVERPPAMQGLPLREAVASNAPVHDTVLYGVHGGHVNVTDGRYVYMRAPARPDNQPLYEYTLLPTHMRNMFRPEELQTLTLAEPFSFTKGCRTLKIPAQNTWVEAYNAGSRLYDLASDPAQARPLRDPAVEQRLIAALVAGLRATDAPPEQFERLGLDTL